MTDVTPTAPRWIPLVTVILGLIGTAGLIVTALTMIGAWRAGVDLQLTDLKKRMEQAEGNQRTYIPVLIGLSKDVTYLAERARREDDREIRRRP
ncbi:hypothetical protein [Sphingomonas sp.]|uniref:hypothetical protein n=1 Tax=Sphingomonas sp. TaxID=28214 RepID=UPI002ED8362A